jgi:dihydropteroate synthase
MLANTPKIIGILNITPDSFSDGGENFNIDKALLKIGEMIDAGVNIIDIGAESTRPSATRLSPQEEWHRLRELLTQIQPLLKDSNITISIDSYHYQTTEKAIELGVGIINDVSGCNNQMMSLIAKTNVKIVLMHSLGVPVDPNIVIDEHQDAITVIKKWANDKIIEMENKGINKENIIFDPGIGFGKTKHQSLHLIKNIEQFRDLGLAILVGHSRKSFMSAFTKLPASQRDIETYAISIYLAQKKVDYIRVHDVSGNIRAINAACYLFN